MIGDAGCVRSFAGVASLVAAAALIATGALADGESGTCPSVWAEYVELVRNGVGDREIVVPVVFEARDGTIYNCLGLDIAPEVFAEMQRFVRFMHYFPGVDLDAPLDLERSQDWPANVCSISTTLDGRRVLFFSVGLPSADEVLRSEICRRRVQNSLLAKVGKISGE